ncbi:hypothetical protein BDB01DRAFT_836890 [Pilobolus umbonatus]|nr:hypothetical protein BDB01DRAFT_836890 [Pilobolus umbonatus]
MIVQKYLCGATLLASNSHSEVIVMQEIKYLYDDTIIYYQPCIPILREVNYNQLPNHGHIDLYGMFLVNNNLAYYYYVKFGNKQLSVLLAAYEYPGILGVQFELYYILESTHFFI